MISEFFAEWTGFEWNMGKERRLRLIRRAENRAAYLRSLIRPTITREHAAALDACTRGDASVALELLERVPSTAPSFLLARASIADLLLRLGRWEEAEQIARNVVAKGKAMGVDGERHWKVHDLRSKNGLCCDGEPLWAFVLRPGLEVRLGSLRLIAESMEVIGLLSFVRRCLGWVAERQEHIDQALQSLRDWAAQRAELVIVGDGDLRPVVRRLHNLVIGADVSFTWYEPAEGATDAAAAVKTAATGTLCIEMRRQADAVAVVERVRGIEHMGRPQLVLCTADLASAATIKGSLERPAVIHVPPLASRASELEDIVQEYAWEIAREQRLPGPGFTMQDLEQLGALPFRSLAAVEDTALRLIMLRTWGLRPGAARLGIDHSSLRAWAQRRKLET